MKLPILGNKRLRGRLPALRDWVYMFVGAGIVLIVFGIIYFIHTKQVPIPYQNKGITASWIPGTVKHWEPTIIQESKKYDLDPNFMAIIMTMESGGDSKALSSDNAVGLMQITSPTAKDIASKYLKVPVQTYNLDDPSTNIEFGAAYLAYLRDQFATYKQGPDWNASVESVAAGYNGGPLASAHLMEGKGLHDPQTVIYSRDAFNMWRERNASDSPTFDRWKERGGINLLNAAKADQ
ncbi:MAG: lytic transglycosylase domain-containing protein [Candidatus Saccharimonadales bacterium]